MDNAQQMIKSDFAKKIDYWPHLQLKQLRKAPSNKFYLASAQQPQLCDVVVEEGRFYWYRFTENVKHEEMPIDSFTDHAFAISVHVILARYLQKTIPFFILKQNIAFIYSTSKTFEIYFKHAFSSLHLKERTQHSSINLMVYSWEARGSHRHVGYHLI